MKSEKCAKLSACGEATKCAADNGFEFTLIVNGKEAVTFKFARS